MAKKQTNTLTNVLLAYQTAKATKMSNDLDNLKQQNKSSQEESRRLRQQLEAQNKKQLKEEQRQAQQRAYKELLFKLRGQVEEIDASDNTSDLFTAMDLEFELSQIKPGHLEELPDKEYLRDTLKLFGEKMSSFKEHLGAKQLGTIKTLYGHLKEIEHICRGMAVEYNKELSPSEIENLNWPSAIRQLSQAIGLAEELIASTSVELGDYYSQVCPQARRGLVEPFEQNDFMLRCHVMIAKADGKLESSEEEYLRIVGQSLKYPTSDIEAVISDTTTVRPSDFKGTPDDAKMIVRSMYRSASADGDIDKKEKLWLVKIGRSLGLSNEDIAEEARSAASDGGRIDVFDVTKAIKGMRAAAAKDKALHTADDVPSEIFDRVVRNVSPSSEEDAVLIYEKRMLGIPVCSGMLTSTKVYFWTPKSIDKVEVEEIERIEPKILECHIHLKNGRPIKLNNLFNNFAKSVSECLSQYVRRV